MGLMYIFPVNDNDPNDDRVVKSYNEITLKSYGLPMVFWGYLVAILVVIFVMYLASHAVIVKLLSYNEDPSMIILGHLVQWTLFLSPVVLIAFFFYEKNISKKDTNITITHKVFFLPILKRTIHLKSKNSLDVRHFLNSPNIAKKRRELMNSPQGDDLSHFENKGYFELMAESIDQKFISIDRHSRKADLLKIKEILSRY